MFTSLPVGLPSSFATLLLASEDAPVKRDPHLQARSSASSSTCRMRLRLSFPHAVCIWADPGQLDSAAATAHCARWPGHHLHVRPSTSFFPLLSRPFHPVFRTTLGSALNSSQQHLPLKPFVSLACAWCRVHILFQCSRLHHVQVQCEALPWKMKTGACLHSMCDSVAAKPHQARAVSTTASSFQTLLSAVTRCQTDSFKRLACEQGDRRPVAASCLAPAMP